MERKRLAEDAAKEITKRIHDRMWVGRLPGIRPIAAELGVSPSTVVEALEILQDAGAISPAVTGKRRKFSLQLPRSRLVHRLAAYRVSASAFYCSRNRGTSSSRRSIVHLA